MRTSAPIRIKTKLIPQTSASRANLVRRPDNQAWGEAETAGEVLMDRFYLSRPS